MRAGLALLLLLALVGCAPLAEAREAQILSTLADADLELIRSRPDLAAGKYVRMANDPYAFYRGVVPLFRRDAEDPSTEVGRTAFASDALPLSLGDAHVENFGVLRAADGAFALEPNDFDGADRFPYHWDLRRLSVGMVVATRLSNDGDDAARAAAIAETDSIVEETLRAYAEAMRAYADGAPREAVDDSDPMDVSSLVADAFRRSRRDQPTDTAPGDELNQLTEVTAEGRRFLRGSIDAEEPEHVFLDVPRFAYDALGPTLADYRETLVDPPAPAFFDVLDAVRELGTGVASWPRVRVLVLVRGATDDPIDDVILEVKELADSGSPGWRGPYVIADSVPDRVRIASRRAWARPDAEPLWGGATWLGMPVQIRREAEMHKTLRVSRLVEDEGTPDDLRATGRTLGRLLARVHADPSTDPAASRSIADAIDRDRDGFVSQECAIAVAYADQVERDHALFVRGLMRVGTRLGIPTDAYGRDRASADWRALYGVPVAPPAIVGAP
ncbi:MAG: DUF2252 family protein [Sandaracinaceae bacterium]